MNKTITCPCSIVRLVGSSQCPLNLLSSPVYSSHKEPVGWIGTFDDFFAVLVWTNFSTNCLFPVVWDVFTLMSWWRHQMQTFSALLAICAGNSPVTGEFPHKGQWRGALMFSLIVAWINGWVNNHDAGDLRRNRVPYGVTAMWCHCNVQCGNAIHWFRDTGAPFANMDYFQPQYG